MLLTIVQFSCTFTIYSSRPRFRKMNFSSKTNSTIVIAVTCLTLCLSLSNGKNTASSHEPTLNLTSSGIDDDYIKSFLSQYRYQLINPPKFLLLVAKERSIYFKLDSIQKNTSMDPAWNTSDLLSSISKYLMDYEKTSLRFFEKHAKKNGNDDEFVQVVSSNMLTVLLTVRRFKNYIQNWLTDYDKSQLTNLERSVLQAIRKNYKHADTPERFDFHFVHCVIYMTHFQLDLKAKDIASGKIGESFAGIELNVIESLDIALHAHASGMYPIAIEWLELVVEKISSGDDTTLDLDLANRWLQFAKDQHDEHWKPKDDDDLEETFFVSRLNVFTNGIRISCKLREPNAEKIGGCKGCVK